MATLTYVSTESTAVLGPLALRPEPHGYDLCSPHAAGLSVPRGWEAIRLTVGEAPPPTSDDLLALADAVREVGFAYDEPAPAAPTAPGRATSTSGMIELGRRGHLTVLADPDAAPPAR